MPRGFAREDTWSGVQRSELTKADRNTVTQSRELHNISEVVIPDEANDGVACAPSKRSREQVVEIERESMLAQSLKREALPVTTGAAGWCQCL